MVTSRLHQSGANGGGCVNLSVRQDRTNEIPSPRVKTIEVSKADKKEKTKNQLTGNYWYVY